MEPQGLEKAIYWWAVGLFLGLSVRILFGAMKGRIRRVEHLDDYVKDNSVIFLTVAITYTGLVVLWRSTNMVSLIPMHEAIDIFPKVVNAWSIVLCFFSDLIWSFITKRFVEKFVGKQTPPSPDV